MHTRPLFKKTAVLFITFMLAISILLCSCSEPSQPGSQFYKKLLKLEGVVSVTEIDQKEKVFAEKYMVTFTQPLDWDNPDAGTFEQRIELGYRGDDAVNCYQVGGYCFNDKLLGSTEVFSKNDSSELASMYNGNFINIEYRFFGESVPEGLSNDRTDYWQYLTVENAAKDFKAIIDTFSTILVGKKTFSGGSKGGFTTNTMAYYYPDLCDAYVSYVAPLCDGTEDPATIKNIYETIGNEGYPTSKAAEMREKILNFQVYCIENRNVLQEMLWAEAKSKGYAYREYVTKEILCDMEVLDFGAGFWQYGLDFSFIDDIMNMPDSTEEEHAAKIETIFKIIVQVSSPYAWSVTTPTFPYYVQAFKEMGENYYDFSYLRTAVIKKTGSDLLAITEDMNHGLLSNFFFTEEQKALFTYDNTLRKNLIAWSDTTDAHIIMIYGGCDVWYAVRIPDTQNPNVHIFVQKDGCHSAGINTLADGDKTTCTSLLDGWLGK